MNRQGAEGFTLVELVTVLVLLGIVSIYVASRFFDGDFFRSRGYFDELVAATRYAQKLAVASGCEARIVIAAGGFTLEQPATAGECGSPASWQEVSLPGKEPPYAAPSGASVTAGTGTLVFSSDGAPDAGPTVTVNGSLSFKVYPVTGFVERL